jgi:hypothetical protein
VSETSEFVVGEAGPPHLLGEGESPPEVDAGAAAPLAVLAWTPPEVSAAISQWWNLGCLWFGPDWQARPTELNQVSVLLAPYFDGWFPKGGGTDPGLVMVALACLATGITMAVQRAPVIAAHWRKPWIAQQLGAAQAAQQAQASAAPPTAAGPAADSPAPAGTSYKLPRDLAAVVTPPADSSLVGLGI